VLVSLTEVLWSFAAGLDEVGSIYLSSTVHALTETYHLQHYFAGNDYFCDTTAVAHFINGQMVSCGMVLVVGL
jgi:hypothetical protein